MPGGGTPVTIVDLLADKESLENRIIRIHSKVIGWNAVKAFPWDGGNGC